MTKDVDNAYTSLLSFVSSHLSSLIIFHHFSVLVVPQPLYVTPPEACQNLPESDDSSMRSIFADTKRVCEINQKFLLVIVITSNAS